jgi:CBS domain-containing protein
LTLGPGSIWTQADTADYLGDRGRTACGDIDLTASRSGVSKLIGFNRPNEEVVAMKVSEIMTRKPITVKPNTPLKDLIERIVVADVGCLPVTDDEGNLLGLVTETDLLSKEAYAAVRHHRFAKLAVDISGRGKWLVKSGGAVAADCMTKHLAICTSDEDVRGAARRMLEHGIKHLPVVEDFRLVGIVTARDILRMFDRSDEAIAEEVAAALVSDRMPDEHHVWFSVSDGVVTLAGVVRGYRDDQLVVSVVQNVVGVIDVVNRLHHRERNSVSTPRVGIGPW